MSASRPSDRRRRAGGWHGLLVTVVVIGVALAVAVVPRVVGDAVERRGLTAFYVQPPGAAEGAPGTLVRSEPLVGHPFEAGAWRIMYRTTGLDGAPVVATGVVVTPLGPAPPEGRTVLAWGHPTTGTALECAPSRGADPFLDIEGMRLMLARGYTIVATDYVGTGTDGPASYLVAVTAGNSVLDSVRAARAIPAAHAGTSVVMWGHSQGGHAVLLAAERAAEYAPELRVRAVATAAPAADLTALLTSHLDDVSGATIGSYAFQAYAEAYADRGARLDLVLTAGAEEILPRMNRLCLLDHLDELHRIAAPVVGAFYSADPATTAPWAGLLRENSAGTAAFDAPLLVAQGARDRLVLPADTERFVAHELALGIDVTYHRVEEADHGTIAYLALPALTSWLDSLGL
ncbi:alpha-beta hydrolase superfamily lysophospholipase [Salana multivorans]|uniref:Alpha-beta hydrolase superfamily lysophospholipase n=1 Tax=Salana multivorans TaxID=120377 RepID=A0A3N2D154_9MICO|nr:alpha/beta fold hydrolase [Salana multivorans]ROR93509.1 alpha-beta hydrolase superfamily lysophospholipase [Salana multivorans]